MTVPNEFNTKTYELNGSATQFDTEYQFYDESHLNVYLVVDGKATQLTLGTDYSVSGVGDPFGGHVTYPLSGPPADNGELLIERIVPIVQETSFRNQGAYYPETNEQVFDESRMIDQQLQDQISRAMTRPQGENSWDAEGSRIINVGDPQAINDAVNLHTVQELIEGIQSGEVGDATLVTAFGTTDTRTLASWAAAILRRPIYLDNVQELDQLPTEKLVDGNSVIIQGSEYKWNAATQEWVNISGWISPKAWGLTASGDETDDLQAFGQYAIDNGLEVKWDGRDYTASKLLYSGSPVIWSGSATIRSNKTQVDNPNDFHGDVFIQFTNESVNQFRLTQDFSPGDTVFELDGSTNIQPGDLLHFSSTRLCDTEHRGQWNEGDVLRVKSITGTTVTVETPICYGGRASLVYEGTVTSRISDRSLELSNPPTGNARDSQIRITVTDGTNTETRYIVSMNGSNAQISQERAIWPAWVTSGVSYTAEWITEVNHYKNAKLNIVGKDIKITRPLVTNATPGDQSFRGVRMVGYDVPTFSFNISNFPTTNVHTRHCYVPIGLNMETTDANRAYNQFGGTGYGISVEVCRSGIFKNIRGARNRRTLDFSGSTGYSSHCSAINVSNSGGGVTYAGQNFFPNGNQRQSVVGSHGTGRFCRYINCEGFDTYGGVNLRGRQETVNGYTHYGSGNYCVGSRYGSGHDISNITYDDKFTEINRGEGNRAQITSRASQRVRNIIQIDQSGDVDGGSNSADTIMTTISGVRGSAPTFAVIAFTPKNGNQVRNVTANDLYVSPSSEESGYNEFRMIRSEATGTFIDNCFFDACRFNVPSAGASSFSGAVLGIEFSSGANGFQLTQGGKVRFNGTWYVDIPDGTVARIPLDVGGTFTRLVSLSNIRAQSSRPMCAPTWIFDMAAGDNAPVPNKQNVSVHSSMPNTSGITPGNVGINLNVSAGILNIGNATGGTQGFAVTIH